MTRSHILRLRWYVSPRPGDPVEPAEQPAGVRRATHALQALECDYERGQSLLARCGWVLAGAPLAPVAASSCESWLVSMSQSTSDGIAASAFSAFSRPL